MAFRLKITSYINKGKSIIIELNEYIHPGDYLRNKDFFKYSLLSSLTHEMSHVVDVEKKEDYSTENKEVYFNSEKELKALTNAIILDIEIAMPKQKEISKNLIKILEYNELYEKASEFLKDESKKYILQSLYTYFNRKEQENS